MRTKASKRPAIKVGDYALLGGTRASYPGYWYHASVLWVGTEDMLVQRSTQNGETWRETASFVEVRAFGSMADLVQIERTAREECRSLQKVVTEAESALAVARKALFDKLEELAAGGLAVIAPDFTAIEDERQHGQALREQAELELPGIEG
jgi:hypothetical protein